MGIAVKETVDQHHFQEGISTAPGDQGTVETCDLQGRKIGDLDAILKEAMATDKPVIVDVPTYPYENCYPMIPAGMTVAEMIDTPEPVKGNNGSTKEATFTIHNPAQKVGADSEKQGI